MIIIAGALSAPAGVNVTGPPRLNPRTEYLPA